MFTLFFISALLVQIILKYIGRIDENTTRILFLFVYFTELEKAIHGMMNTRTQYTPVLTIWRSERKLVLSANEAIPGH